MIRRMDSYMAVKVRLDPTPRQVRLMASHAGAARFAYNTGLARVKEAIGGGEPPEWSHYSLRRWWNANKDVLAVNQATGEVWWSQNSKEAYSEAFRDLARGFSNWSKSRKGERKGRRVGFPRFKSKNTTMRFAYSTAFTSPTASYPYGLNVGLKALRKAQQALSRKVKGSARREKAKGRVARLHARVADVRADALHKATSMIASNYDTVCIEELHVAGMVKNHNLARSVSDAALGEFRRQLEYKTARTGAVLRVVGRWFPSSKTCSNCGVVKAKLSLSERTFNCDACGLSLDRDVNAAINICVAGSAPETLNARGVDVSRANVLLGNVVPGEARTKRAHKGAVRLGVGLGNEAIRPSVS